MIAQTQLIRTHSPVSCSAGITYFIQGEQAYKNSDGLDPPCLLARGEAAPLEMHIADVMFDKCAIFGWALLSSPLSLAKHSAILHKKCNAPAMESHENGFP